MSSLIDPIDPLALVVAGLDALCREHRTDPEAVRDLTVYARGIAGRPVAFGDIRARSGFDLDAGVPA